MAEQLSTPDENLRAAILAAFRADMRTAGTELRVGVLNSIAHLAGAVATLEQRSAAEGLARSVNGVRGVVNRIEAPGGPNLARTIDIDLKQSPTQA